MSGERYSQTGSFSQLWPVLGQNVQPTDGFAGALPRYHIEEKGQLLALTLNTVSHHPPGCWAHLCIADQDTQVL